MMRRRLFLLVVACCCLGLASCEKEESPVDYVPTKKEWISGTWKQKDLLLGVTTTVAGFRLTEGNSMLTDPVINAVLTGAFGGNPFLSTANNGYVFNANGTYTASGDFSLIQPEIGSGGQWDLEVYGSVLALFPTADKRIPNWVNNIRPTELNLGLTVNVPGLGDVPMNLLLEKQ